MLGIEYPPVQLEYVIDAWQEMGVARYSDPLTWSDINAYVQLSGVYLNSQECATVIEMSKAYLNQLCRRSKNEVAPWQQEAAKPQDIAAKFRTAGRKNGN